MCFCNKPKRDCEYFFREAPEADYCESWCTRDYNYNLPDGRTPLHCENCKYYKKRG